MKLATNVAIATSTAACIALLRVTVAMSAGPEDEGKALYNNYCRTCHSPRKGDNRLGPSLNGIVGKKAGQQPGYASYSQALKQSGVTWDEATLDKWIENPDAVVPNNNMKPYKGIPDPAVRRKITEFLESNRDAG
jgi:cytochrome c